MAAVDPLAWTDPDHGTIDLPGCPMRIHGGFGSGLARRAGDAPGIVWAVCDRGPNLNVDVAVERYGLDALAHLDGASGAKIMPQLALGPTLAQLRVHGDIVGLIRTVRLRRRDGEDLSGVPIPGGPHAECEPAFDLNGEPIAPDPMGADSEGVAALADGGFWVGDEYGPSLLRIGADGRVIRRLLPVGGDKRTGKPVLPAIAGRRQLNRGFEALALAADEQSLFLVFQSPLAHPDEAAHKAARHVRLWQVDLATGAVLAHYAYPLDPPESFRRDRAKGKFARADVKVGEISRAGADALLVLERGSETSKIYRVRLDPAVRLGPEQLDLATRPTLEERSAGDDFGQPVLAKELLLSTDDHPHVTADLEGMTLMSPTELLLVNDNDFGLEGAETRFWRVRFNQPVA